MAADLLEISEKRQLVERVANSTAFRRSPRLREFLLYVADCTLADRLQDARELQIAQNIFHRKPDYNAGQDNIVRVEARSLRKRLEAYFESEGKDEPIVIVMPKGGYAISFEPRAAELASTQDERGAISASKRASSARPGVLVLGPRVLWAIIGVLVLLLAAALYAARSAGLRLPPSPRILPFSALIDNTHDTYIITSDTSLVLIQELLQRQISLDDYLARRFEKPGTSDEAKTDLTHILQLRNYTNAAEMGVAAQMIQRKGGRSQRIFLRSSRDMQFADVKSQNVILLGGPIGNPWVKLFSDKLNFQFDMDDQQRGMFRNRSTGPGEQPIYSMTTHSGESGEAYAVVAFLPNVNRNGHVLLIAGTTSEGTQAGGEFIMDEVRSSRELSAIGIDPSGPLRYFEILLKAKTVAGSATESTVVAHRLIPSRLESPIDKRE